VNVLRVDWLLALFVQRRLLLLFIICIFIIILDSTQHLTDIDARTAHPVSNIKN
jgi:hypothetical protein